MSTKLATVDLLVTVCIHFVMTVDLHYEMNIIWPRLSMSLSVISYLCIIGLPEGPHVFSDTRCYFVFCIVYLTCMHL